MRLAVKHHLTLIWNQPGAYQNQNQIVIEKVVVHYKHMPLALLVQSNKQEMSFPYTTISTKKSLLQTPASLYGIVTASYLEVQIIIKIVIAWITTSCPTSSP